MSDKNLMAVSTPASKTPKFLYLFSFLLLLILVVGGYVIWYQRQFVLTYKSFMTKELTKCYSEKVQGAKVLGQAFYEGLVVKTWNSTLLDFNSNNSEYSFKYPDNIKLKTGENTLYFISKNGSSPSKTEESVDFEIKCQKDMAKAKEGEGGVCAEAIVADMQMRIRLLENEENYTRNENCTEQNTKLAGKKVFACISSSISGSPEFDFGVIFGPEGKRYLADISTDNLSLTARGIKTIIESLQVKE